MGNERLSAVLPSGQIVVTVEAAEFDAETLFTLAARDNPKRAFLFLSKVLGKHLPVAPARMAEMQQRIARRIPALPGPVLFIGMAETATCLGQGVFEAWLKENGSAAQALYLHTTRHETDTDGERLFFEEAHSHAPKLWLYAPSAWAGYFAAARSLVLIDDEISTGKTLMNLVQVLQTRAPRLERVHLATLTDFMGAARRRHLTVECGIPVSLGALLSGQWRFESHATSSHAVRAQAALPAQTARSRMPPLIDPGLGRLGRTTPLTVPAPLITALARAFSPASRVLVLGTGEFMHPPYVLARAVQEASGAKVHFHASSRSPILPWGPITHVRAFPDNYGEGIAHYLYNHGPGQPAYDAVFLCHETGPTPGLIDLARALGARLLHFCSEFEIEAD